MKNICDKERNAIVLIGNRSFLNMYPQYGKDTFGSFLGNCYQYGKCIWITEYAHWRYHSNRIWRKKGAILIEYFHIYSRHPSYIRICSGQFRTDSETTSWFTPYFSRWLSKLSGHPPPHSTTIEQSLHIFGKPRRSRRRTESSWFQIESHESTSIFQSGW